MLAVRTPKNVYLVLGFVNPIETGCGPRASPGVDLLKQPTAPSMFKKKGAYILVAGLGAFQSGGYGSRTIKWQEGGRFIADSVTDLPVDVLPLATSKLMYLKVDPVGTSHLSSLIGHPMVCVETLTSLRGPGLLRACL